MNEEKSKFVVFDVEGVLIPKNRYLLFEVGRKLCFPKFMSVVFYGLLYELGLVSLEFALKRMVKVFKGFSVEVLLQIFRGIPLMPYVEEAFEELRRRGWKTALISSGLPNFAVEELAARLKADYAFGFELETEDGVATGKVSGDVIERQGKFKVLRRILEREGLTAENCIVVADDRNNAPMMLQGMLKIGYNPDFLIRLKADYVMNGGLNEIFQFVDGKNRAESGFTLPSKNEVTREVIHACGFSVPVLSSFFGRYPVALLIIIVSFLYFVSEVAMMEEKSVPIISWIAKRASTTEELYEFATAPLFFALGILFTLLLFPEHAGSPAIATFALGDSAAAIIGRTLGKRRLPFNKGKTLEGLIACLFAGFLGALVNVDPLKALTAAAVAALIESLPLPVNDNLAIPLATASVLTLVK